VRERPILMNAPMVRAVLAGTKTQTRRVAKVNDHDCKPGFITPNAGFVPRRVQDHAVYCPYGQPGDRLWVRETWAAPHAYDHLPPRLVPRDARIHYAASEERGGLLWRPSIHMPRWASRLTLEITEVRVERLNEISEEDAKAEGIAYQDDAKEIGRGRLSHDGSVLYDTAREAFVKLWESINGPGSWDANPWVWVVSFRRLP